MPDIGEAKGFKSLINKTEPRKLSKHVEDV